MLRELTQMTKLSEPAKPPERRPGRVLVVGSVNADLVVRVRSLPSAGETVTGGDFAQHHGGKGANQAVAAARLGAHVTFIGAVGDDEFGRAAVDDFQREGVGVSGVRAGGAPTGVALIVVDDAGENQIAVASGANASVDAAIVEEALATGSTTVAGGVYLANFEIADEAVLAGARIASEAGMKIVINPAPARELPAALLALRPILVPNEGEAQALTGEFEPINAARILAARSGAPVVVTLGPQGAVVVEEGNAETVPAPLVEAVDTTGAGDTFAGALAAELAAGSALIDAVRFAVRAASMSVTVPGARGGMPSRAEVEGALGHAETSLAEGRS
ncbi:MAG: ribokinase [Chloroflexota bacterium]